MIKKLLFSCAVAAVALSASAEELWKSDSAEGVLVDWGQAAFFLSPEDAAAKIKAGDMVTITVSGVTEGGWPQVCIFKDTKGNYGDSMIQNAGVGGKEYPFVASFSITPSIASDIAETGISFGGNGAYVSAVGIEKGTIEVDPNAVWFGPKKLNWGDGLGIQPGTFADLKVGDKLVAVYDKASTNTTLQIILGAWNGENAGPNVATYQAGDAKDFMTIDAEAGTITVEFIEALSNLSWVINDEGDKKDFDVFSLVKAAGVQMQGPGIIMNQVLYIPATETPDGPTAVSTIESVESSVIYNVFGQPVDDNYRGIVIKNGKKIMKK